MTASASISRRADGPAFDDPRWDALISRDASQDGDFVYAVRSTGIYCRPSCPSRKPSRAHVEFFDGPDEAEEKGFRPCKRCTPRTVGADVLLASRVVEIIAGWQEGTPTLADLSEATGISPSHLQRTFKKVTGVSPAEYARGERARRLRANLKSGNDVTTSLYEAGFDSSSALYGSVDREIGMTPGEYGAGGAGTTIKHSVVETDLGMLLIGFTERGVSAILIGESEGELIAGLASEYPKADLVPDPAPVGWIDSLLSYLEGRSPHPELPFSIRATAFQRAVWEALQAIPPGETRSYGEIAAAIGRPGAARAVARACAANRIALAIPCHRVVRSDGSEGGYRWGVDRKRALLALERDALTR